MFFFLCCHFGKEVKDDKSKRVKVKKINYLEVLSSELTGYLIIIFFAGTEAVDFFEEESLSSQSDSLPLLRIVDGSFLL